MTLEEICKKYNISESSIKTNFARTQVAIQKKYGIKIRKEGRGQKAQYYDDEIVDDGRAITLYNETKDKIPFVKDNMALMNWDFIVFLAIAITPMGVFRGSFFDFLKYVEININDINIEALKNALSSLQNRDLISYNIDKTDNNYFTANIYRQVEVDMKIGIDMVRDCKRIQEKYHKRSWVPILKVWLSINMFVEDGHQPYTVNDIKIMTGLSDYQVRDSVKLLKDSQIFKTSKAYASYARCLGTIADLNVSAFYALDKKQ